jgi:hypothetical protein
VSPVDAKCFFNWSTIWRFDNPLFVQSLAKLTSLIDQSQDKSLLISQILQTKLGKAEADKLAKDWIIYHLKTCRQLMQNVSSIGQRFGDLIILYSSNL